MPAVVLGAVLFKVLHCKIKNVFFVFVFVFFMLLFVCSVINLLQSSTIRPIVLVWRLGLTLLDLRANWTYKHALGMELIHLSGTYCI